MIISEYKKLINGNQYGFVIYENRNEYTLKVNKYIHRKSESLEALGFASELYSKSIIDIENIYRYNSKSFEAILDKADMVEDSLKKNKIVKSKEGYEIKLNDVRKIEFKGRRGSGKAWTQTEAQYACEKHLNGESNYSIGNKLGREHYTISNLISCLKRENQLENVSAGKIDIFGKKAIAMLKEQVEYFKTENEKMKRDIDIKMSIIKAKEISLKETEGQLNREKSRVKKLIDNNQELSDELDRSSNIIESQKINIEKLEKENEKLKEKNKALIHEISDKHQEIVLLNKEINSYIDMNKYESIARRTKSKRIRNKNLEVLKNINELREVARCRK